jgi:hypothetical protein
MYILFQPKRRIHISISIVSEPAPVFANNLHPQWQAQRGAKLRGDESRKKVSILSTFAQGCQSRNCIKTKREKWLLRKIFKTAIVNSNY